MNSKIIVLFFASVLYMEPLFSVVAQSNPKAGQSVRIEKVGFNKTNATKLYEMSISYPVVHLSAPEVEHQLNLQIQDIMAEAVSEFKRKLNKLTTEGAAGFSYIRFDYDVRLESAEVVSLRFMQEIFLNDGKSKLPTKRYLTTNFLVANGQKIGIGDLFTDDVDIRKELATLLKSRLGKCKVRPDLISRNFSIEKTGLMLSFDDAALSDRDCPGEVLIRWEEISKHLKIEGVLSLVWQP